MLRKTIYIVDDDAPSRKLFDACLRSKYDIKLFENGSDVLNAVEKRIPDLLIIDINMPKISGVDVIRILSEDEKTKNVPVIIVTAYNYTVFGEELKDFNIVRLLRKPININELIEVVRLSFNMVKKIDVLKIITKNLINRKHER